MLHCKIFFLPEGSHTMHKYSAKTTRNGVFSRRICTNSGAFAAQQLTAVNCALHHSQSSHAKTHPAKFEAFVLLNGQRTQQSETDRSQRKTK
jgi:hypothetical protein